MTKYTIKDAKNTDDGLSTEQKVNQILEMIEKYMTQYPEWVDEPGNDRCCSVPLLLHKSQMLLVKEGLEKLLLL